MSEIYLMLAKSCIGWGLLLNLTANWLIARAHDGSI